MLNSYILHLGINFVNKCYKAESSQKADHLPYEQTNTYEDITFPIFQMWAVLNHPRER